MILPIVQLGDPILRATTRPLTEAEIGSDVLRQTVEAMRETMYAAPGVGLAAPQVGLDMRLAVIEDRTKNVDEDAETKAMERRRLLFTVLINASYEPVGTVKREFFEGCLSMPGYRALVKRHAKIRARWIDLDGDDNEAEFFGWPARIVQHEIDHLDGIIYTDLCSTRSLTTLDNLDRYWTETPISEVRRILDVED